MMEFVSLTVIATEIGKTQLVGYKATVATRGKKLHQKLEYHRFKVPLKKFNQCKLI